MVGGMAAEAAVATEGVVCMLPFAAVFEDTEADVELDDEDEAVDDEEDVDGDESVMPPPCGAPTADELIRLAMLDMYGDWACCCCLLMSSGMED